MVLYYLWNSNVDKREAKPKMETPASRNILTSEIKWLFVEQHEENLPEDYLEKSNMGKRRLQVTSPKGHGFEAVTLWCHVLFEYSYI